MDCFPATSTTLIFIPVPNLQFETARNSINRVKQWEFEKIIIAHGQLITKNAQYVFNKAFDWI